MGKCLFLRKGETHTAPISVILASDLAVGSSVYLMENGTAAEYLVVHQGLPSSLYDASCDGTWLLRKDIKENRQWHSSNSNSYEASTIHSYLNSTFLGFFDSVAQSAIKQVKIPYRAGSGYNTTVSSGASGLSAKIFLLAGHEVSVKRVNGQYIPTEGALLSYFASDDDAQRIAYFGGTASYWYLRSPQTNQSDNGTRCWMVQSSGTMGANVCTNSYGIRPALILPSNALFDKNTLILKGVA